jgi:arsenate reductase
MSLHIKVLGGGCANCHNLEKNARAALVQLGVDAEIEHVSDPGEYARYGLLFTPGLVVNDKLVSAGRVPTANQVATLLVNELAASESCPTMRQVLFLCTGNSCRSQMAEAIVNARLGDAWQAVSAGTALSGYVHPLAVRALAEIGIEHSGRSKHVDEFRDASFDLVVTVCDSAAEECPLWLPALADAATPGGQGCRAHLSFLDPARATGAEEEVMAAFRQVRDDIAAQVPALLQSMATGR